MDISNNKPFVYFLFDVPFILMFLHVLSDK